MHERFHPFGGKTALFTDNRFHNLGVGMDKAAPDLGRFEVTGDPGDRGRFKTPTLRNVALTAPYMHDGSLATLEEVVDFYNKGGIANPTLDPGIRRLGLTRDEKVALVEFLRMLTDQRYVSSGTDRSEGLMEEE
jgi:cytochrome c peroxidase